MNIAAYIGLPYRERGVPPQAADCWTLIKHFMHKEFGVEMPRYFYNVETFVSDAENLLATAPLGEGWEKLDQPEVGAVLLFRISGRVTHCGLYLGDGDFLHTLEGRQSCVERLTDNNWNKRLAGIYKWKC
jgi:cell wall-associated NlpC family hydrolase